MTLGVVLAGGQSTRFGSDKALAELHGQSLLSRAVEQMRCWCEEVVVVGRDSAPAPTLPDWPKAGMGPLGGLAAALNHAQQQGHVAVLSMGVDVAGLPDDLPAQLAPAPAYLESQPVIGLWPASAAATLRGILTSDGKHSMRQLAEAIDARPVKIARKPANINTPADLVAAEQTHGI